MKSEHLIKMLDMLTSGYTRRDLQRAKEELPPITNIGKLFSCLLIILISLKSMWKGSGYGIIWIMRRVRCWIDMALTLV